MRFELRHFENDRLDLGGEYIDTTDNQHVIATSQNAVHTDQCASTGALIVVQGREVLGTIAQQRHTLFGKVSEHQFAGLARSNRLEGLRIYNLGEIMVFVEVSAVLARSLVTYTGTGKLAKSINIKSLDSQLYFNIPTHIFGPWLGAKGSYFQLEIFSGKAGVLDGICQIEGV